MIREPFTSEISYHVWDTKYRYRQGDLVIDKSIQDTWLRVAQCLASCETSHQDQWQKKFYHILEGFKFLPGGRILAGAGTKHHVTLFNCFVMGLIGDSIEEIFESLKEGAITMQQGGGVGYDFSTLRPRGMAAQRVGAIASGPISFMDIWNKMCSTILSTGSRRGAMMATLRCDHPDIEEFIDVKRDSQRLRHFNLSVLVTDDFMKAVQQNDNWPLVFPLEEHAKPNLLPFETIQKEWPGNKYPVTCQVFKRISARDLWEKILKAAYDCAEPGVLFIDRINHYNNLYYRETISATNPCGEIPLAPYGACNLGSLNLTCFVKDAFTANARFDLESLKQIVPIAIRMLDNVIDCSSYPLDIQELQAKGSRHIGLGITGLADTLILLGINYADSKALELITKIMQTIAYTAYKTSTELSREKEPFPYFAKDHYLNSKFIASLPADIKEAIATYGIRNSHLLAIAPTGTISLLANNVSHSLEPAFDLQYKRTMREYDGALKEFKLTNYAFQEWQKFSKQETMPPPYFVKAYELDPLAHLEMQAVLQKYVDNAISKTINIPQNYSFEQFKALYLTAYDKGLKGCTVFRPNPITGHVLETGSDFESGKHCCGLERESD